MSNNWNQPPHNNNNPDNPPPKTGGLLRNYKSQQLPPNNAQPSINSGSSPAPQPGQFMPPTKSGLLRSPVPSQQPPLTTPVQNSYQAQSVQQPAPQRSSGLLSNTMDVMRQFSGKMAALAGYQHKVEPPAPYLERYHNPNPPSNNGMGDLLSAQQKVKPWRRSRSIRIIRQMRNRRERWQQGPARLWSVVAIVVLCILVLSSFAGSASGYAYYQQQLPHMYELANLQVAQTTRIYDRNNVLLYESFDTSETSRDRGRRTPIRYEDLPEILKDAMIAIEDKSFWTNNGIDPSGLGRAIITRGKAGGGSTLTQQIIKNLSGDARPTPDRKLTEGAMAIGLTQTFPKSKILEMYFNIAPFGALDNGVESATQTFFKLKPKCDDKGKCIPAVSQLDLDANGKKNPILGLARASLLAAIPNNPTSYDPTNGEENKAGAMERQTKVLNAMLEQGKKVDGKTITPAMVQQAKELTAKMKFEKYKNVKLAPHFVDWVIKKVAKALGNGDYNQGLYLFKRAGLNIKTTIDARLVDYTERAIKRHLNETSWQQFPGPPHSAILSRDNNVNSAAALVMDAKTGEILSMVGSADYYDADIKVGGQYNVVDAQDGSLGRAPGSTMKPLVYSAAFEMGWNAGVVIPDVQTYFPNGAQAGMSIPLDRKKSPGELYVPTDYAARYNNMENIDLRFSTANSFNVPAVKAIQFVGTDNALNFVKRLGLSSLKNDGPSWALGSEAVPLIQMVGAYQTLANSGKRVLPQGILEITDNYGNSLFKYEPSKAQATQVVSPQVSYMMTSVLMDEPARNYEFEGIHTLSFADKDWTCAQNRDACSYQVATKTGTTDDFKDNLTIGYTPEVVVGVWAGNANNEPMDNVVGITGAAPIWHSVMERTVGWCNQADDQVACDANEQFNFRFSKNPQWKFTPPAGISLVPLNNMNGLAGGGEPEWVIDGTAPQITGTDGKTQFDKGIVPDNRTTTRKNN